MSKQQNKNRKTGKKLDFTFRSISRTQDNSIVPAIIHGYASVSSSAGGVINASVSMDPNSVSNTDWADFNTVYDEFRVLGIKVSINSNFATLTPGAATDGLIVVAYDNDSSSALTTFTSGQQYNTARVFPALFQNTNGRMLTYTWYRPTSGKETTIPWIDVASPSNSPGAILFYASGLTNSTLYFYYTVQLLVEFRGRR